MRKTIFLLSVLFISLSIGAQKINRKEVVTRNNPHITRIDSLSSLTVGNGSFAFTVDVTGLQTFPDNYKKGVPLGTMSDWGWHAFENRNNYKTEETLENHDFHRGHTQELYAAQFKNPGRQQDASKYFRSNPHRLHLGYVGLNINNPEKMSDIDETLNLWTGKVESRFNHNGNHYHVQTVCDPDEDLIASHIESSLKGVGIKLRVPYPTGGHSDDASDWTDSAKVIMKGYEDIFGENTFLLEVNIDKTRYFIDLAWQGKAKITTQGQTVFLTSKDTTLDFYCRFHTITTKDLTDGEAVFHPLTYKDFEMTSAGAWNDFWTSGGFVDFGHVKDPRAKELERRVILSQYLLAAQETGDTPPQETGLTYNSWFGKFHLEMIWWHQSWLPLWNHPQLLDKTLDWYHTVMPVAKQIATRQGFKGVRWMKMTDPIGLEAPSNVGSYLIWQQPHPIYLAELLYRASDDKKAVLSKYADIVQRTAEFMADFAEYDSIKDRYILRGCIPAQETLKADSTVNPPFELSYWLTTLKMAQDWRVRMGAKRIDKWDKIIDKISPLAFNKDSLYLASETAVNTYTDRKCTSDHPALLGALGILPDNKLINDIVMKKTLNWIWNNWNWDETWGWDYPMVAMTCARLGLKDKAVDALLMKKRTNTYLVNGHNYQDGRLRIYMPGNGGLLTAVAMMCAGWDGNTKNHPGFPSDWDVRFENINPMP